MRYSRKNNIHTSYIAAAAAMLFLLLSGCRGDKKEVVGALSNPKEVSTIFSRDVTTLISDSGITRYRVVTKEWYMYEQSDSPRWYFPKGLYIETFDENFDVEAFIEGDTAIYYKYKRLWELKGDVRMANIQDERFFTEQLFWNQDKQQIYSDSTIHIERGDRIIEGQGFLSNESMTKYKILKTTGIFPVEKRETNDSVRKDASAMRQNNALKYAPQDRQ
ncbi:MAG: LPS export ABC transporter periplasmic protein LptC [Bacteroidetes bacterium]|uniref:LPS export ABC transporter periplasmic protein LptC n=1 Tax=Candidatus Caccoplasma merdipullorum TaxID=2840718 RepID=A0A9D9E3J1_9BACT|nr:LPS export ABC transporter periplasmic protein LptC [Candidatus Caccoplasma merdipullorum]